MVNPAARGVLPTLHFNDFPDYTHRTRYSLGCPSLPHVARKGHILEDAMKKLALAAALSIVATGAFAGGVAAPAVAPVVIAEDTSSSAGGVLVPVLALILIAAAVANNR